METGCHIRKEDVFDWSELRDLPLTPIGYNTLALLGTLPDPEFGGREGRLVRIGEGVFFVVFFFFLQRVVVFSSLLKLARGHGA